MRSAVVIALAINAANPSLPKPTVEAYARTIQKVCVKHACDPLTIVAMVEYESRFRASAVGVVGSEEYVGLGQIRLRNYPECRGALGTAECQARKAALLDGNANLRVIGSMITASRKYCRRATGREALFARWLAVYQGIDWQRKTTCNQKRIKGRWVDQPLHRLTRKVIVRRAELARKFGGRK